MSMKLRDQLVKYLLDNEGSHASGELQRIYWSKYAYGEKRGFHTPRSVVRRLEELAEENLINVEYKQNHAWYSAVREKLTPKKQIVTILPSGAVSISYQQV